MSSTISSNWSRENLAWAAGLFEGEGCISVCEGGKRNRRAILQVSMTDEDVLKKFHSIVRVGHLNGPYMHKSGTRKPAWLWSCNRGQHIQAVIAAFWPFLCSRRKAKAEKAIAAFKEQFVGFGPKRKG